LGLVASTTRRSANDIEGFPSLISKNAFAARQEMVHVVHAGELTVANLLHHGLVPSIGVVARDHHHIGARQDRDQLMLQRLVVDNLTFNF